MQLLKKKDDKCEFHQKIRCGRNRWNDNIQKSRATFDGKAILKRNLDIFLVKNHNTGRDQSAGENEIRHISRKPIMCHHDSKKGRRHYAFSSTAESHRGQVNRETSRFLSNVIRNTPLFLIFRPRKQDTQRWWWSRQGPGDPTKSSWYPGNRAALPAAHRRPSAGQSLSFYRRRRARRRRTPTPTRPRGRPYGKDRGSHTWVQKRKPFAGQCHRKCRVSVSIKWGANSKRADPARRVTAIRDTPNRYWPVCGTMGAENSKGNLTPEQRSNIASPPCSKITPVGRQKLPQNVPWTLECTTIALWTGLSACRGWRDGVKSGRHCD